VTESVATTRSEVPSDDALDLTLRMVLHLFGRAFKQEATAGWSAPGAVVLLGASPGGPALAVVSRWGAKIAGRARDDGRLHVSSMHHPDDDLVLHLATRQEDTIPAWAAGIPELASSLLGASSPAREFGGASLLVYMDVPDESGILAGAALHTALAVSLADLAGLPNEPAGLLAALGGHGEAAAAYAASLSGRHGHAMLITAGSAVADHVAFDPAAAGLRLVLMSARPDGAATPPHGWTPDPSDGARVGAAAEAIAAQDWAALGTLFTTAHRAGLALRETVDADLLVDSALATGALGGRATSSTTALALVPARSLRDLRAAAGQAFAQQGRPAPRILTTGAFPPAVARPESLLES
jgi:galactokinase